MNPDFWLDKWNRAEIGFHMPGTHPLLARYWPVLNRGSGSRVLVPLCGKSVDMLHLLRQGCQVTGIELSPLAIRQFFDEHDLKPVTEALGALSVYQTEGLRLMQGDFFAIAPEDVADVDAVYDRAALIALPPQMQSRYAGHLMALAGQWAPILLITLDYPSAEMQGPPFPVPPGRIQELFGDHYHIELLEQQDALADNPAFLKKGVTRLFETAWHLYPR